MIAGASEGEMMLKENYLKTLRDTLTNFFGVSCMKIVGILKPTGTFLDNVHIIKGETQVASVAEGFTKISGAELNCSMISATKFPQRLLIASGAMPYYR